MVLGSDRVIAKVGSFDITLREPRYLFATDVRSNTVVWSVELPAESADAEPTAARELIDVQHELAARLQEAEVLLREIVAKHFHPRDLVAERVKAFLDRGK